VTRLLPLAFVLVSLGLVACGGDDAPSRADFARDAERICREIEREFENLGESADSPEEVAEAIDRVTEKSREAADELVDLERPEGNAGENAERFAEGFRQQLNDKLVPALEDLERALREKDAKAVQEAGAELQKLDATEADRAARELGATACLG
jgi:hypothetical protein